MSVSLQLLVTLLLLVQILCAANGNAGTCVIVKVEQIVQMFIYLYVYTQHVIILITVRLKPRCPQT